MKTELSPEQILDVERETARRSFRFWCNEVLGLQFVEHVHGDILDALQAGDWDEMLIMLPRDCYKSSLCAAYVSWRVVLDRNFMALLVGITFTKTQEVFALAQKFLERDHVTELFGVMRSDHDWSKTTFTVSGRTRDLRSPTLTVMGRDSFNPGGHYDLIWFDDPESRETVSTEEQVIKTRKVDSDSYPMLLPDAKRVTTGTFWDDQDLYNYKIGRFHLYEVVDEDGKEVKYKPPMLRRNRELMKNDGTVALRRIVAFHKPAAKPDLTDLLFPERLSEEYLLFKRDAADTASDFSAQYLLDPVSRDNAVFLPSDFLYDHQMPDTGRLYIGLDVAHSREKSADYIGMTVANVDPDFQFYIHEALRFQMDSRKLWDKILSMHLKYTRGNRPPVFAIEEDHYVKGWKPYFLDWIRTQGHVLWIEWIPSFSRNSKHLRIESMQSLFRGGSVRIAPGQTLLEDEGVRFPAGRYRDVLDSLTNIHEIARKAMKKKGEEPKWGNFRLIRSPLADRVARNSARNPTRITTEPGVALTY